MARVRPENGMQMYYSDVKQWTPITLQFVSASTEKAGTFFAKILCDGRERYLQIDADADREVLAELDTPATLEIKNFGSKEDPKLLIKKDGVRIDAWRSTPAPGADALVGALPALTEATAAALAGAGVALGRSGVKAPTSIRQMAKTYGEAYVAARALAAELDPKGTQGFNISEAAAAIGGWYVFGRLLGAPADRPAAEPAGKAAAADARPARG